MRYTVQVTPVSQGKLISNYRILRCTRYTRVYSLTSCNHGFRITQQVCDKKHKRILAAGLTKQTTDKTESLCFAELWPSTTVSKRWAN